MELSRYTRYKVAGKCALEVSVGKWSAGFDLRPTSKVTIKNTYYYTIGFLLINITSLSKSNSPATHGEERS